MTVQRIETRTQAPDHRLRHASFDVGVPPIELATAARASRMTPARIALLRSTGRRDGRLELLQTLAAASEARVEWSEASGASARDVARALAESDAVVVEREPDFGAGDRVLLPRFHTIVGAAAAFGSALAPRSPSCTDRLLVGAIGRGGWAWERSAREAFKWARAERRRSVSCILPVADPAAGTSLAASRFRRIAIEHPDIGARASSLHEALRQLVLDPASFDVLLAEAGELEALARAMHAGVGAACAISWLRVSDTSALLSLGPSPEACAGVETADSALTLARAMARLLRQIGEDGAALRLGEALRAELGERLEVTGDLWLDLACETPAGLVGALCRRLSGSRSIIEKDDRIDCNYLFSNS